MQIWRVDNDNQKGGRGVEQEKEEKTLSETKVTAIQII